MKDTKWDKRFMAMAEHIAQWSKDPSTKVGAVIIDHDRRVTATGYNGFPRYVTDDPKRYEDKMVKYKMVVHAEANAILNALVPIRGNTLYCTKYPCSECAKLIIQSGISRVFAPNPSTEGVWADDASFTSIMLREASIPVHIV